MSRYYCLRHKAMLFFCVFSLGGAGVLFVPPAAHASEWLNLLKPFVRDVVAPAATNAAKRWVEKRTNSGSGPVIEVPPAASEEVMSMPDLYVENEAPPVSVEEPSLSSTVPPPPPPPVFSP